MGNYALERTFQKQGMDEEDGGCGEEACIISIGRMASSGYKTQEGMCDDHALWAVSDHATLIELAASSHFFWLRHPMIVVAPLAARWRAVQ